ncbi:MAG: aldo/keto reductase [Magnetococcales bacterium]|nr:aldo/keto reductase [Magnetococcales bacterium]
MQYRLFGHRTGRQISVLTLGTMRFLHGWDAPHDDLPEDSCHNSEAILRVALQSGINLIETARGYGKSERLIGRALARIGRPRSSYLLMTKAAPLPSARQMRLAIDESLQRLGVDFIDFFALHGLNTHDDRSAVFGPDRALAGLQQAQAERLIGHIGFSTHATFEQIEPLIATGVFDFVNLHYYAFRPGNRPAVAMAHQAGMGVLIISPNDKGGHLYQPSHRLQQLTAPLHPVHYNERWLLRQSQVHTLSIGLSEPDQLAIHLASLDKEWDEVEQDVADRLDQTGRQSPWYGCLSCTRCLPCPQQIDIPELLRLACLADCFGLSSYAHDRYGQMRPGDRWVPGAPGDRCDRCGDCLPRCPAQLVIPEQLQRAHHLLAAI